MYGKNPVGMPECSLNRTPKGLAKSSCLTGKKTNHGQELCHCVNATKRVNTTTHWLEG